MSGGRRTPLFWAALTSALVVVSAGLVAVPASVATAGTGTPTIIDVPTAGTPNEIAIDDDTVVTGVSQTVSAQTVDFNASTVSDPTQLGTGAISPCGSELPGNNTNWTSTELDGPTRCGALEVSDGTVIWSHGKGATTSVSDLSGNSYTTTLNYTANTNGSMSSTAVSGTWFLNADTAVVDATTGNQSHGVSFGGLDLLHGDLYEPGQYQNTTGSDVIVRNLATGVSDAIPVAECPGVMKVQAAGSWMLLTCETSDGLSYVVVDRTGTTPARVIPLTSDYVMLGNGFLAEVTSTGALNWTPLDGDSLNWSTIVTVSSAYNDFAVSRGQSPTLAWIDSNGAHAALLPVTPSPNAADPQSPDPSTVPSTPTMYGQDFGTSVTLTWTDPPASDEITGYLFYPGAAWLDGPVILPPTARSYTITGLTPGDTGVSELITENAVGDSAQADVGWTAENRFPAKFINITESIDPTTDVMTVNWGWSPQKYYDPVVSFTIKADDYGVTDLPATARTTSFQLGTSQPQTLFLTANGAHGSNTTTVTLPSSPWTPLPPTVDVTGLPQVASGNSISVTFYAHESTEALPLWVRYREAASSTWIYPSGLQNVTGAQSLNLSNLAPGSAYCVEYRTEGIDGGTPTWPANYCTLIPRDDRTLTRHGSWKSLSGSGYLDMTASESVNTASSLSTTLHASQVWVVATTCPTCGTLGFRIGGTTMLISLKSATTVQSADVEIPWGADINSTVYLDQYSSGKPVTIDGIAYLPIMTSVPAIAIPPSRNGFECTNPSCRALS